MEEITRESYREGLRVGSGCAAYTDNASEQLLCHDIRGDTTENIRHLETEFSIKSVDASQSASQDQDCYSSVRVSTVPESSMVDLTSTRRKLLIEALEKLECEFKGASFYTLVYHYIFL
jgi:hypothetical protein